VVIDDKVWVDTESNLISWASKSNRSIYWPCLLEKLFAKLNGNFNDMAGGANSMYAEGSGAGEEVFMSLLFGPGMSERFRWDDPPSDNPNITRYGPCPPDVLFEILEYGMSQGMMFTASPRDHYSFPDGAYEDGEAKGLVYNHAYSVIRTFTFSDSAKVLQLRNNWGSYEWTGPFGDSDTSSWTEARKKEAGYENKDDGLFYISLEAFHKFFYRCNYFVHASSKDDKKLAMFHDPECFRNGPEYRAEKHGLTW
jgi:hypothetical protein